MVVASVDMAVGTLQRVFCGLWCVCFPRVQSWWSVSDSDRFSALLTRRRLFCPPAALSPGERATPDGQHERNQQYMRADKEPHATTVGALQQTGVSARKSAPTNRFELRL
jgi:hypothetical protein